MAGSICRHQYQVWHLLKQTVTMEFFNNKGSRDILCTQNFLDGKTLSCEIHLDEPEMDSIVISIPWKRTKKPSHNANQL